jgi:hypothetical protein
MYVIRLPNGNLRVPQSAVTDGGEVIGDAYVELGPDDPDYDRLRAKSITEEELAEKRRSWRAGDEELRRQFEEWKAGQEGAENV